MRFNEWRGAFLHPLQTLLHLPLQFCKHMQPERKRYARARACVCVCVCVCVALLGFIWSPGCVHCFRIYGRRLTFGSALKQTLFFMKLWTQLSQSWCDSPSPPPAKVLRLNAIPPCSPSPPDQSRLLPL